MIDQVSDLEFEKSISSSIEANRCDIFKAMLETIKKGWKDQEFQRFLNKTRDYGTLLHLVSKNNQPDMVRILLNYGADPTILDQNGEMPLKANSPTPVKIVFNNALFASIAQLDMPMTKKLTTAAVDLDIRDNPEKLNTPLHWAVSFLNIDALYFFVEQGATLNCTNAKGLSPLHEAVLMNNFDTVQALMKLGADLNFPVHGNSELKGKIAIDLAVPESPIMNLLSTSRINGHATKPSEVISDNANRSFQRSGFDNYNHPPISPGSESTFSMDEVTYTLPLMRAPIHPVVTDTRLHWLWPPPKQMQQISKPPFSINQSASTWNLSIIPSSISLHKILDIWDIYKPNLSVMGVNLVIDNVSSSNSLPIRSDGQSTVTCCVKAALFQRMESYRLTISSEKISVVCSCLHGLHYALNTLQQLIALCQEDGFIPALHIEDSPSLRIRAIFLDVSPRGRVPLLNALFSMIEAWSSLKLNQLHLYTRISSEDGEKLQWPWPYSKIEVISLDRFCRDRGMELVPALDIEGDAIEIPRLQTLINFTQSCFPTTKFFHAGPKMTSLLVDSDHGFLLENTNDITWLLCSNSLREKQIPIYLTSGFILVEYGFQASVNFHEKSQSAWEDSQAICFCAGTASWDCLASYPEAAAANILHAVHAAVDRGSLGSISATWTDSLSIGSLHFAWPGWMLNAGLSWNHSVHWDFIQNSLGEVISLWILNDFSIKKRTSIGTAIVEMGRLETWLLRYARGELHVRNGVECSVLPALPPSEGGSIHYKLLFDPDGVNVDHITMESVVRAIRHSKKWHKLLMESVVVEGRFSFTKTFLNQAILTADFGLLAGRILRGIISVGSNPNSNIGVPAINPTVSNLPATLRTDAANKLLSLTERFQQLWLEQYQAPSTGLNNIVIALNTSIQRLLTCSEKAGEI